MPAVYKHVCKVNLDPVFFPFLKVFGGKMVSWYDMFTLIHSEYHD